MVVPIPTLPAWLMVKRANPDEEAVNKSPTLLSTTKPAKLVLAEIEATGVVPEKPATCKAAFGEVIPIPRLPPLKNDTCPDVPASLTRAELVAVEPTNTS